MSLKNYRKKRDFDSTKEPEVSGEKIEKNVFVVQKHDAKKLHYDIRLEIGGLLKSWAIPKGPSLDPSMKRLAIPTEDHPIEYLDFEGKIPKGSYGAGFVIVWDKGKYENRTFKDQKKLSMKNAYKNGHITVLLKGQKLKGEFSFIKLEGQNKWLLIKKDDSEANREKNILDSDPESVISGKKLEDLKENNKN